MKTKLLLLSLLSVLLIACNQDEPQISTSQQTTPTAKFSFSVNGLSVKFLNSSKNADTYSWDFGDGETSTGKEPTHVYSKAGAYKVTLTAKKGTKSNSTSLTVTLKEQATKANFTFKTEHPLKVVLTNTSTNATSFVWSFGDGTASTEKNPTHRYDGKGVYKVKLTAKNGTKEDVYSINVTIEEPTKCFLAGYEISKVPQQNEYYQIRFTDQYTITPTNFGTTSWMLLSNANMPVVYNFSSPKQITGYSEYWCSLWQSNNKNGNNASRVFRCNVTREQLFTKFPESLTNLDQTKAIIKMNFLWK